MAQGPLECNVNILVVPHAAQGWLLSCALGIVDGELWERFCDIILVLASSSGYHESIHGACTTDGLTCKTKVLTICSVGSGCWCWRSPGRVMHPRHDEDHGTITEGLSVPHLGPCLTTFGPRWVGRCDGRSPGKIFPVGNERHPPALACWLTVVGEQSSAGWDLAYNRFITTGRKLGGCHGCWGEEDLGCGGLIEGHSVILSKQPL